MISRKLLLVLSSLFLVISVSIARAQDTTGESDQQISEFSLVGYEDKGKKGWDLAGKSADIFDQVVKLKDVIGNMYGKEEDIKITAKKGDFNKADGKVHLEDNVVVTTTTGTKLTTDSLDWDRKNQMVSTPDVVNIKRQNMTTVARGAKGEPNLKQVVLEKDVRLDITPEATNPIEGAPAPEKIIITCDGPLEIDYAKNIAVFKNNVKVDRMDSTIYSDKMDVYFIPGAKKEEGSAAAAAAKPDANAGFMGSSIDKIIARGNVRIIRGQNTSYSDEAIYTASDKKILLTGQPKLILYSMEDFKGALTGN